MQGRSYGGGGGGGEGASLSGRVGGSGGILPHKIFKFGGSETLASALVMRYRSRLDMTPKNRPRISVKRQVFSVLTGAYFRGPVNLKHTVYPSTSTLNISRYCTMFG